MINGNPRTRLGGRPTRGLPLLYLWAIVLLGALAFETVGCAFIPDEDQITKTPTERARENHAIAALGMKEAVQLGIDLRQQGLIPDDVWNDQIKPAVRTMKAALRASEADLLANDVEASTRNLRRLRTALGLLNAIVSEFAHGDEVRTRIPRAAWAIMAHGGMPAWTSTRS